MPRLLNEFNMKKTTKNKIFELSVDQSNIAELCMRMPGGTNKINLSFISDFHEAVELINAKQEIIGIILSSTNRDFCVGADLDMLGNQANNSISKDTILLIHKVMRTLETSGKTVVAALNGSALGAGYELALACHYRIALRNPKARIGLPEVKFGVIPGAGGTQRLPRLVGIQKALECILQGKLLNHDKALHMGLIDELVEDKKDLLAKASSYIKAHLRQKQPWDTHPASIPGPKANTGDARNIFLTTIAMLEKKTAGVYLAPKLAVCAVQEGLRLNFEQALQVEARYFFEASGSSQASAMINTFWHHKNAAENREDLPKCDDAQINKVGVVGAGMMGAGLAVVCTKAGYEVVLKDVTEKALNKGFEHCQKLLSGDVLARIKPSLEAETLKGCDLIIEAVFENLELKHKITKELEPQMNDSGIWASNTSALPITELAQASQNAENFIGMHFFSPAEKMQLVEIIVGEKTSKTILARSLAFAKKIRKLPIVVNDGYAFFTSRVFCAYVLEGAQLVAEGHEPVLVEWAAKKAGMAVGPLRVLDEVTLKLIYHAITEGDKYVGKSNLEGLGLLRTMINEHGRLGRAAKKGFYDYNGERKLWPGLKDLVSVKPKEIGVELLQERLMLLQCAEVARTIDDGILRHYRDAELGTIFGLGFAPQTGGPLTYMDNIGIRKVVAKLEKLTSAYGKRYRPAKILLSLAEKNGTFFQFQSARC